MKAIFVLFDSLTKKNIYEGRVKLPNFERLANKTISFETHYCGSLPCIPARRDLHTGRMHFLHSSWGPLEPFDKSFVHLLNENGVHTHLITDHQHYFEQGGSNYHTQYTVWEFFRGQEGDPCKSLLSTDITKYADKYHEEMYPIKENHSTGKSKLVMNHILNRECIIKEEKDFPLVKCFQSALEFLDDNHSVDNWFLNLECFDPHEPFYAPLRFRKMVGIDESVPIADWIPYGTLRHDELSDEIRRHYDALLLMCDEYLGKLLDKMDELNLWDDTLLILTTDHGLLFGEHDLWGKSRESYYEEVSHIPLYIHHPKFSIQAQEKRFYLTQTPDIMPTILEYFKVAIPEEVKSVSLLPILEKDCEQKKTGVFGMFGGPIGITDGEYVYYHYPSNLYDESTLNEYTLMPQHMRSSFSLDELKTATITPPFEFTQEVSILKFKALNKAKRIPLEGGHLETESALYNLKLDPEQKNPIFDEVKLASFKKELSTHLKNLDAPSECYTRFGLSK